MKLTRRQWLLAGFLAVFALGYGLVSLVPGGPVVSVILGLAWLGGAIFLGWRWFPEPPPVVHTPDLTVPEIFLPSEPEEPSQGAEDPIEDQVPTEPTSEVATESVEAVADAEVTPASVPDEVGEPLVQELQEPQEPQEPPAAEIDWTPIVELLEALDGAWTRPDPLGPRWQEVSGNAAFIRQNVQQSYEIADNLAGSAQRAFALSEKVQKGVVIVTDALVESLKQTEILSEHSQRITGILQLMGEVSDKIHVLSINASIVSARAGTAGRGFEVVAKEIRALAKETEHSLGDIVEVIELLRSSIKKVIQVVRDADLETEQEKSSLIEVAGALQGVILGVEIVKAVSGFAKEKAEEQDTLVNELSSADRGPDADLKQKVAAVKARLEEWKSKE